MPRPTPTPTPAVRRAHSPPVATALSPELCSPCWHVSSKMPRAQPGVLGVRRWRWSLCFSEKTTAEAAAASLGS